MYLLVGCFLVFTCRFPIEKQPTTSAWIAFYYIVSLSVFEYWSAYILPSLGVYVVFSSRFKGVCKFPVPLYSSRDFFQPFYTKWHHAELYSVLHYVLVHTGKPYIEKIHLTLMHHQFHMLIALYKLQVKLFSFCVINYSCLSR